MKDIWCISQFNSVIVSLFWNKFLFVHRMKNIVSNYAISRLMENKDNIYPEEQNISKILIL